MFYPGFYSRLVDTFGQVGSLNPGFVPCPPPTALSRGTYKVVEVRKKEKLWFFCFFFFFGILECLHRFPVCVLYLMILLTAPKCNRGF